LFRRDPFEEFRNEIEQLMSRHEPDWSGGTLAEVALPSTDVSETDEAIEVKMDIPGLTADEITIEVRGNRLQVSGEHKEKKEEKGTAFHRVERSHGRIFRSMALPVAVKEDKVEAECQNGVLTITLPKAEEEKTRKISVKAK
jgi:HSP20 family protein